MGGDRAWGRAARILSVPRTSNAHHGSTGLTRAEARKSNGALACHHLAPLVRASRAVDQAARISPPASTNSTSAWQEARDQSMRRGKLGVPGAANRMGCSDKAGLAVNLARRNLLPFSAGVRARPRRLPATAIVPAFHRRRRGLQHAIPACETRTSNTCSGFPKTFLPKTARHPQAKSQALRASRRFAKLKRWQESNIAKGPQQGGASCQIDQCLWISGLSQRQQPRANLQTCRRIRPPARSNVPSLIFHLPRPFRNLWQSISACGCHCHVSATGRPKSHGPDPRGIG